MDYILEMKKISKSFGNVHALMGVDFCLKKGEVVALLGDNGAGKSTLIKIMSGLYTQDSGEIVISGDTKDVRKWNVRSARESGIETVYQDRALGYSQPLWRNLFAGRHIKNSFGLIDVKAEIEASQKIIDDFGLSGAGISPNTPALVLSGGERQGLAIGRAMYFRAEVVVLDEPTTALAVNEVEYVLNFARIVRDEGRSVVIITHSIDHAWSIADRFVILSHGRVFCVCDKKDLTLESLLLKLREASR